MDGVRIRLLGPLSVTDADGRTVDLGGALLRVLLTALALDADRPVSAARLIDTLWPDEQPANPGNALQALVSRLRGALGRDLVPATPVGYRLDLDPAEVDVHRFEQLLGRPGELADALALWRGPALADVPDAPGFAEAAARLEALRANAREDLIEAGLTAGGGPRLLSDLQALTAESPLRDRPRALLMRALHQAGRTAEALTVYEEGRVLLADALGADPSPLLRKTHLAILAASAAPTAGPAAAAPPATSPVAAGPRLPAPLTSFLGREAELAAVHAELAAARLVTLTGPGGTGKTRLALEAAAGSAAPQVQLVELAPVSRPAEVPATVLTALRLRESGAAQRPTTLHPVAETVERIVTALGNRPLLLVLDNCEHVIDAAADLTARLLADCPGLRVLATSREPLGITGEQLHPVPPLAFPAGQTDEASRLTPDQALGFSAVRLFADRAAAVRPGYTPDADGLPAVLRICRALDGQPLAIELAAARMRSLSPEQIDQRLTRRFHLLTGGSRTVLPRHRTLRAVVDWSWELLEKPERALLARMSVFAGGADLETVEQVCATEDLPGDEIMDVLSSLVDKSLVTRTGDDRYRLLETIRAYAGERLEASGTADETRNAHAAYFLALAETGESRLFGRDQLIWFARFTADHDNLVAALRWSVEQQDAPTAQRLVAGLGWYLWRRGERGELDLVTRALELPGDRTPPLALAVAFGITALYSIDSTWDLPASLELMRTGIRLRDQLEDPFAHPLLPMLDIMAAMFESKDPMIEEMAARLFDAPDPFVRATAYLFMGFSQQNSGFADSAERHLREASQRFQVIGDRWGQSFCAAGLADYAKWRGDLDEAMRLWELAGALEEELGITGESGDYRARLITAQGLRNGYTRQTLEFLQNEAEAALREGSWMMVIATHTALANAYRHSGTPEAGRSLLQEAVALVDHRAAGVPQLKALLAGAAGMIEAACGDFAAAAEQHRIALAGAVGSYDGPIIAESLQGWADLALRQGDPERAAELLGAAVLQRGLTDLSSPDVARISAAAEAQLGRDRYAQAHERGRSTPREETLASLGADPQQLDQRAPRAAAAEG